MARSSMALHAFIGAIVGVVLSFIPFSTVLGGAVAGFLEGSDVRSGAIAGTLSGAVMFLPVAGGFALVVGFLGLGLGFGGVPAGGFVALVFVLFVFGVFVAMYTIGLAAIGGLFGAMLAEEFPEQRQRIQRSLGLTPSKTDARYADQPPSTRRAETDTSPRSSETVRDRYGSPDLEDEETDFTTLDEDERRR
ncbi:DUF5518 domain-containing protein [Natronosalvus vescus]|uniref:DUF5518 domain-containing protein n=1 Tax=Natronosalvus vescus TaxID=2953881 RepID=UPI00208FFEFB|nr:DUF5518 domain-containing protein [Natronosalvus vescus]